MHYLPVYLEIVITVYWGPAKGWNRKGEEFKGHQANVSIQCTVRIDICVSYHGGQRLSVFKRPG